MLPMDAYGPLLKFTVLMSKFELKIFVSTCKYKMMVKLYYQMFYDIYNVQLAYNKYMKIFVN
jgi:hypothetical protein